MIMFMAIGLNVITAVAKATLMMNANVRAAQINAFAKPPHRENAENATEREDGLMTIDRTHNDEWLHKHAHFDCQFMEDCASSLPAKMLRINTRTGQPICEECFDNLSTVLIHTDWDDLPAFNPFPEMK